MNRFARVGRCRQQRAGGRVSVLLAGLLLLAGCSIVPDVINPFAEVAAPDEDSPIDTSEVPGADQPYPNLASVPDGRRRYLSAEQREGVVEGLVADRENATYSGAGGRGVATRRGEAPEVTARPRTSVSEVDIESGPPATATRVTSIGFGPGSTELSREAEMVLQQVARAIAQRGGRLLVYGHAGATGDTTALDLSAARARAVVDTLVVHGVDRDSLSESALADAQPPAADAPDHDLGLDRAEIFYVGN